MKALAYRGDALVISATAAMLAGCGGLQPIGAPGALHQSAGISPAESALTSRAVVHHNLPAERMNLRPAYSVLYGFKGGSGDGDTPFAELINVKGTLYGTTVYGGGSHCFKHLGCGTAYSVTTAGVEGTLNRFNPKKGADPSARLLDVNGTLYGTTLEGGSTGCIRHSGCGTVYEITASGEETVLHSFADGSGDGVWPHSGLINVKGVLYGTTYSGGANGLGTVFAITTSGTETVLYSFAGGSRDGADPTAALINVKGVLYGTTEAGGSACRSSGGCGTVFAITTSGAERVLYSFKGYPGDGRQPQGSLTNVKGMLYGTTYYGGANSVPGGTVFAVSTSGKAKETVLHNFGSSGDGAEPAAGLINVNGMLYGTTLTGGANGYGTVFAITTSGAERVLHNFGSQNDGEYPYAPLLDVSGMLYGTTTAGGEYGRGTVFSLSP